MATCPVCGKICKSPLGLDGHIRLKNDVAHAQYRGYPTSPRTRKVKHVVPSVPDDNRLREMENELIQLKQQLQQQPTEERSTKGSVVGDIEKIVHHIIDGLTVPSVKPEQPVQQVEHVSEERQILIDKKADDELFEMLSEQLDGWPVHDAKIEASAPEHLRERLWKRHFELL